MKFFNRKEEVLDIELTQYGKFLLSKGVFRPAFYAFYDDDIIYDSQYMGGGSSTQLEHSTKESDRIRSAPRPHTQYNYGGVESTFDKLNTAIFVNDPMLGNSFVVEKTEEQKIEFLTKPPAAIDNYDKMALPMGISEYNSDKLPAWDLKMVNGEITGSVQNYTGSSGIIKIPQIDIEVFYETEIKQFSNGNSINADMSDNITAFGDGTYIEISKDHILIDLTEHNSLFENENFEIEAYHMILEPDDIFGTARLVENYRPLYFVNGKKIVNEVYYSEDMRKKIEVSEDNVEYYFDLRVDDEITDSIGLKNNIVTDIYKQTPKNDKEPC
jgi:putative transposon-encoded protein|tara:strand:+ start:2148 stop:3128 length:981 start_codon:yes stop_codon:yes gene_type:complete